jgi:hypothetical protein
MPSRSPKSRKSPKSPKSPKTPPSSPISPSSPTSPPTAIQVKGAGILFYRDNTFLTGFSTHLKRWSGFGGKIEESDKSVQNAAIREVVEEIYGFTPPEHLIDRLKQVRIINTLDRNGYTLYLCDIDEIKWIGALLIFFGFKSPYYEVMPRNVIDLITKRKTPVDAEVTKIEFITQETLQEMYTDHHFLKDTMLVDLSRS